MNQDTLYTINKLKREYRKLVKKIDKLDAFIDQVDAGEKHCSDTQYRLLKMQVYSMCAYAGALEMRVVDLVDNLKFDDDDKPSEEK